MSTKTKTLSLTAAGSLVLAAAVTTLLSDVVVWPWQAYARKEAQTEHKAMGETLESKDSHKSDITITNQRIQQCEESTKALVDFTEKVSQKMDKMMWHLVKLREEE